MSLEQQLIFLFSALGAINGFMVSGYFLLAKREKRLSDYFLGGLLLMLSIRIIKSVFLFFNKGLFEVFIQGGLTACFLIGPFLFLYVKSMIQPSPALKKYWWAHILPYFLLISYCSFFHSYYDNRDFWRWFIPIIYKQWFLYILLAGYSLRSLFSKLGQRQRLEEEEFWLLNIFSGTTIIWCAYEFSRYTSYIVGALSFTFLGYISLLLWLYKKSNKKVAKDLPLKYANSTLDQRTVEEYLQQIETYLEKEKAYLNPELTLVKLSEQLGLTRKDISQVINQSRGQNYSNYIAQLRVEEAQRLLQDTTYDHYKIAAIAYESGFNSLSSFNNHFKKVVGETAISYRKRF
ncbi:MAG: helix-turn-helix domain-containing protein [Aureispira sp.]